MTSRKSKHKSRLIWPDHDGEEGLQTIRKYASQNLVIDIDHGARSVRIAEVRWLIRLEDRNNQGLSERRQEHTSSYIAQSLGTSRSAYSL